MSVLVAGSARAESIAAACSASVVADRNVPTDSRRPKRSSTATSNSKAASESPPSAKKSSSPPIGPETFSSAPQISASALCVGPAGAAPPDRASGSGSAPPVELAVGGDGQRVEHDDRAGDERRGQSCREVLAQCRDVSRADDIRDELPLGALAPHDHGRVVDVLPLAQHVRELTRLDADAADLHLVVEPAEVVEQPVLGPARTVAGAVHAKGLVVRELHGTEAVDGQLRPVAVATRQPEAGEDELARDSLRDRPQVAVDDVGTARRQRPSDQRPPTSDAAMGGRVRRVLGRAVQVPDGLDGGMRIQPVDERPRERLAGEGDGAHRGRQRIRLEQPAERRRDAVDEGDLVPEVRVAQGEDVVDEDDPAAQRQRRQELEDRQVEAERRRGEHAVALVVAEALLGPGREVRDRTVLDHHGLRRPGRARGVDQM